MGGHILVKEKLVTSPACVSSEERVSSTAKMAGLLGKEGM